MSFRPDPLTQLLLDAQRSAFSTRPTQATIASTSPSTHRHDHVLTLCTALLLGCFSLYCFSSAIVKFGQAIMDSSQLPVAIPTDLSHQATSQIK